MITREMLEKLAAADIEAVDKNDLTDAGDLSLDVSVPQDQRAALMLQALKNPYCFRVGDMGIKLEFTEDGPPLDELFTDFLIRKKSGQ